MNFIEKAPLVTVAIITRNRADSLLRTINSIFELDYPNFEVIVVNNASTDHTQKVLNNFKNVISVFSPHNAGFSKTRQYAIDAASGEYIAWCDDDCVPEPNWISSFVKRFLADDNIAMLGGNVININFPNTLQFKGRSTITSNGVLEFVEDPYKAEFFGNLNMSFRTSMVKKIGGYDPFFIGGFEEIDLALCLRQAGFIISYEPNAVVKHYHNEVSYKKGRWFYGSQLMRIYLCLKHFYPKDYKNRINFIYNELKLFYVDLRFVSRFFVSSCLKMNGKKVAISLIEMFNVISSRISIPWVVFKVKKRKLIFSKD